MPRTKRGNSRIGLLAQRDGWICNGCGQELVPYEDNLPRGTLYATIDHRDPDGGDGADNVWLMCAPCNSSKHRTPLEEWEKTLDFDGTFFRKGFTQIPNTLLYDASVSMGARMTLICLMQFAWKNDPFPGQKRLGDMLGVTDRTVRDYLSELRDAGYLKVFRRGRGKTNVYRIVQQRLVSTKHIPAEVSSVRDGDDRNQASDLDRNQASGEEYEVEKTKIPPAAAPRKRAPNEQWDALSHIFGEPTTRTAQKVRGKVVSSLRSAGATAPEIVARARRWPLHFDGAVMTDLALEKHWDTLGRKPLRRTG